MSTADFSEIEALTLTIERETLVRVSLDVAFAELLEQLGRANVMADGTPRPLVLESWPGGRWFNDLGDSNGYYWATVQAIKRPTLLEFRGPFFMSYPVDNNMQFRLSEQDRETLIKFRHSAFGRITDEHKIALATGWEYLLNRVRQAAEKSQL